MTKRPGFTVTAKHPVRSDSIDLPPPSLYDGMATFEVTISCNDNEIPSSGVTMEAWSRRWKRRGKLRP